MYFFIFSLIYYGFKELQIKTLDFTVSNTQNKLY